MVPYNMVCHHLFLKENGTLRGNNSFKQIALGDNYPNCLSIISSPFIQLAFLSSLFYLRFKLSDLEYHSLRMREDYLYISNSWKTFCSKIYITKMGVVREIISYQYILIQMKVCFILSVFVNITCNHVWGYL